MDKLRFQQHIQPLKPTLRQQAATRPNVSTNQQSFRQALQEVTDVQQLKVSKHASVRLSERNIHISESQWQRITEKVFEARAKGVNDSLVLTEQAALIVSAKNATVITAMDRNEAKDQLFTKIDGTIVLT
ncbi:flagellar protein [Viridibacillus sp. YIM B01967]|uniref:Flagellar protein n=1 Tax=Viridibacillus soli TaxID=2798301 RepID=A0ABS1H4R9_9BACL|nr:TIGR02530 family flagellar biosynthesis protein [Viridibacillus soli]MBK3494385.1 flagellar protein [Viridibacillus soli]